MAVILINYVSVQIHIKYEYIISTNCTILIHHRCIIHVAASTTNSYST